MCWLFVAACAGSTPPAPIRAERPADHHRHAARGSPRARAHTGDRRARGRGVGYTNARATAPLTLAVSRLDLTGTLPPEHGVRVNGVDARRTADAGPGLWDRRLPHGRVRRRLRAGSPVRSLGRIRHLRRSRAARSVRGRAPRSRTARRRRRRRRARVAGAAAARSRSFAGFTSTIRTRRTSRRRSSWRRGAATPTTAKSRSPTRRSRGCWTGCGPRGRPSNTIVAVTADHGEGLGDHGEATHGMLAYDSTLRVPLIVVRPGSQDRRTVETKRVARGSGGHAAARGGCRRARGHAPGPAGGCG